MAYKCSLTHEVCGAYCGCFYDDGDSCPIGRYKPSFYRYDPGESKNGAVIRFDSTCRFYGIARAKSLETKDFMEG